MLGLVLLPFRRPSGANIPCEASDALAEAIEAVRTAFAVYLQHSSHFFSPYGLPLKGVAYDLLELFPRTAYRVRPVRAEGLKIRSWKRLAQGLPVAQVPGFNLFNSETYQIFRRAHHVPEVVELSQKGHTIVLIDVHEHDHAIRVRVEVPAPSTQLGRQLVQNSSALTGRWSVKIVRQPTFPLVRVNFPLVPWDEPGQELLQEALLGCALDKEVQSHSRTRSSKCRLYHKLPSGTPSLAIALTMGMSAALLTVVWPSLFFCISQTCSGWSASTK
jgi:hypothetical protein